VDVFQVILEVLQSQYQLEGFAADLVELFAVVVFQLDEVSPCFLFTEDLPLFQFFYQTVVLDLVGDVHLFDHE
jgi:hypothetical protein